MNLQAFGRRGSSLPYFCVALIGKNAGFRMTLEKMQVFG